MLGVALIWTAAVAQSKKDKEDTSKEAMGEHYKTAQKALAESDFARAEQEYKQFISEALQRLASRRATGGDLKRSAALLEEALQLAPEDVHLRLNFAATQ